MGDRRLKTFARGVGALIGAGLVMVSANVASAQPPPPPSQRPDLHAVLHIRPDQEAAWRAFQVGTTPPSGIISQLRDSAQRMATVPTPQRLEIVEQNLQLQSVIFHHQADAIRKLYAVLTPDQQRIYDQVTLPNRQGAPQQR